MMIEEAPVIKRLDEFAAELPPEYRTRLYATIEGFLAIGMANGIYHSSGVQNDQREMTDYLTRKAREAEQAAPNPSG